MRWFNSILYVAESSVAQESALARAVSLASNNQAGLTVIDVAPNITTGICNSPDGPVADDLQTSMLEDRRRTLESMVQPFKKQLDIRLEVREGKTSLEAIRAVLQNNHDLLIKPAENPAYMQRLFGSDDMQLLRNCPCPVWLTRAAEKSKYRTILAAVDFYLDMPDKTQPTLNEQIAEVASSLALSDFSELHFIHVWDAPAEGMIRKWSADPDKAAADYVDGMHSTHEKAFHQFREQLRTRIGTEAYDHLNPQFHLRRGAPATALSAATNDLKADLLVMGTVARTGISGWLIGNTAEGILEQVQCSVLAVKPRDFVSPVKLPE